jgi:peptide-methionine (S)-S-oxide reductase
MDCENIALGGGCHWCTEAVFQSLKGVIKVEQGFVASEDENGSFSEAVIVHFNPKEITLKTLIEVHLYTHKSTSNHIMRIKYRSAIYTFSKEQNILVGEIMKEFQSQFDSQLITRVLPFKKFKSSSEQFHNYFYKNPKLKLILAKFSKQVRKEKMSVISNQ